jgi:selenide,water dikinase
VATPLEKPWRLTEQVACGGCASKLGPTELGAILRDLPRSSDPRVLVDYSTGDDAGVYRLDETTLLVQTVDFFTPVVDDPAASGATAAANALSDVSPMGGRPRSALSIAALPDKDVPPGVAAAIFRGGAAKLQAANCALLGGHTVRDPEFKFGYAVTGIVEADQLMTNAAGRPGDALVLTKPLGTGIVGTALKAGRADDATVAAATQSMTQLNRIPSVVATRYGVRCATDVTGLGLIGHAWNIARESRLTLRIDARALPLLPGALALAPTSEPKGLKSNRQTFERHVAFAAGFEPPLEPLLYDPQTSGGLLLLVPPAQVEAVLAELPAARLIGEAAQSGPAPLSVR